MVSDKKVSEEDLQPINLNELPVFTDMMMLEGLLAGASTKSPEIQAISKELTASISGIRDFVLEEILWLAGELGRRQHHQRAAGAGSPRARRPRSGAPAPSCCSSA